MKPRNVKGKVRALASSGLQIAQLLQTVCMMHDVHYADVSPSPCTQEPATAAAAEAIYMQSVPRRSGAMQPHAETPEAPRHQAQTDLGPEPAAAPLRPCFRDQIWNANHSSSPSTSGTPISMPHERGRTTSTAWASADTSPPPQLRRAGQGTSEPLTIKVLSFNIWCVPKLHLYVHALVLSCLILAITICHVTAYRSCHDTPTPAHYKHTDSLGHLRTTSHHTTP